MDQKQHNVIKRIIELGKNDLVYFTNEIFSQAFKPFEIGEHVDNSVKFLSENLKTARISAKDHFKSTSIYAHFLHKVMYDQSRNYFYFSYMDQMSAYHISKIKELVKANPYFNELIDYKTTAEGVIKYGWPGKEPITLKGKGMLSFKKGIHCDGVYVDDPFQEEQKKLTGEQIKKINHVFKTEIMDMPLQGGFLHVVGTAQTYHDFFFDKKTMSRFKVRIMPAIKDYAKKEVLWPEHMDWEELQRRLEERGPKVFNQEYLCIPSWAEDAFFKDKEKFMQRVNPKLEPIRQMNENCYVVGGWDPGKRVHPAHVVVFAQYRSGFWTNIYEKWFDRVPYSEQLEHVEDLIERLKIDEMGYDATRGEFETEQEKGELAPELVPIVFKTKTKNDMATNFDTMISNGEVELLNHKRFLEQILCVDNDLKAPESPQGHGDSFMSTMMALYLAKHSTDDFIDGAVY